MPSFRPAIKACDRTVKHVTLPANERFTVEDVTNKSWSGYNWYQGDFRSLIQVNTDLPIYIDRAIDLACHEGYPGHHVDNALLEKHLVRDRGWTESRSIPSSRRSRSSPKERRTTASRWRSRAPSAWRSNERSCSPPPAWTRRRPPRYHEVQGLVDQLAYAGNEAARSFSTAGSRPRCRRVSREVRDVLAERAKQRVRFMDETAATSSTTTWARIWSGGSSITQRRRPAKRWSEFKSSCRRPGCPPACSDRQRYRRRGQGLMASRSGRVLVAAAILCVAGYVFVTPPVAPTRPSGPTASAPRLPAVVVSLRRLVARRRRA